MALEEYKKKRKFTKTPEPAGKQKSTKGELVFVVQKHKASHLHYDFRLEVNGVLKSWAIPKGPSLNPEDKRLAMMVEDHPYDYKNFEGIIPAGNYGAGTVMVWDKGTYIPIWAEGMTLEDIQKRIEQKIAEGHLTFVLNGEKLKGEFALIKLKNAKEKNAWLLKKAGDQYAVEADVTREDRSVISGRTLEEITENAGKEGEFWISPKEEDGDVLKKSPKGKMPKEVRPMMATLVKEPFDKKDWIFEIKWDGYRAITQIEDKKIRIYSRNNKDFNERFPEIVNAFKSFDKDVVFDGEIVALNQEGEPSFQLLQDYLMYKRGNLIYYIFDILYYDGHILEKLPLKDRREILKAVLPKVPNIQFSDDISEKGKEFFDAAKAKDLEGIMAKNINSTYQEGKRGKNWLKIKNHLEQEVLIGGFTAPRGARTDFGSIAVGVYEGNNLIYIGNVGTGFNEKLLSDLRARFEHLIQEESPFVNTPKLPAVTWLRPELVAEVKFQEWTSEGSMRQPVFLGLREDKKPKDVHKEVPK